MIPFLLISALIHVSAFFFLSLPLKDSSPYALIEVQYHLTTGSTPPGSPATGSPLAKSKEVAPKPSEEPSDSIHDGPRDGALGEAQKGASVLGSEVGVHAIYPRLSRVLGEEGSVHISLRKTSDGTYSVDPKPPFNHYSRLEDAALKATQDALKKGILQTWIENADEFNLTFIFRLR